jgi:hypothetical protein
MRRLTIGVILAALLAVPAFAQQGGNSTETTADILKKKDSDSVSKQYDSTMKRLKQDGTTTVRADPWANMRAPATNDNKR